MFCLNKTGEWLKNKDKEELGKIIKGAMADREKVKALYKERRKEIDERRANNLRKKREDEVTRRQKKLEEREMIFKDILYFGLYQTEEQLEEGLDNIASVGEKTDALKAQLRFRETILNQNETVEDQKLFRFSGYDKEAKKSKVFKWPQLKENCKKLINQAFKIPTSNLETDRAKIYMKKKVSHELLEKVDEGDPNEIGQPKTYIATVISTVPGYPA